LPRRTDSDHSPQAGCDRTLASRHLPRDAAEAQAIREAIAARAAARAARRRQRQRQGCQAAQQRATGWRADYAATLDTNPSNNREHGHAGGQARPKPPKPRRERVSDMPPAAGPVTIRRADGTTTVQSANPPSNRRQARRHRPPS
jgi:hypothetical protein